MATFREMQDRINLDYLNRTDLTQETKRAIIRAVKHFEKNRFWFNMTATALAVGTASTTVAIPADFLALDFCTMRDGLQDYIVNVRSYDRIAYKNQNTVGSGVAQEIAYWQDKFVFTPKPQSATTITVHYTQALPALNADGDTNGWTSAAEDLIVHHATADMLANVLRVADPAQVQAHKAWEAEAYNQLKRGNDMRLNLGEDGENGVMGQIQVKQPKIPGSGLP